MRNSLIDNTIPYYSPVHSQKKYMEFFHVDFCHVDSNGTATIPNLIDYIQETAWQHASHLNIGYHSMLKNNMAFVISRMMLKTRRLPAWNEIISVETWIRPPDNIQAIREFTIRDNNRNLIAAATISYILIDIKTRRLRKIPGSLPNCFDNDNLFEENLNKIPTYEKKIRLGCHSVKPSDLDMNKHVNNSKYVRWIFDYLPQSWSCKYPPNSIQINFHNETKLGNEVVIFLEENDRTLTIEGIENNTNKIVFTSELCFKCDSALTMADKNVTN
jgi:medium-chain acyl-[acyl-carrier-protein] hydrolase